MRPESTANRVIQGYARFLLGIAKALLALAGMAGAAVAVTYPVWWLSTNHRGIYSALVLGGGAVFLAVLAVRRLAAGGARSRKAAAGRVLRRAAGACFFLAGAYGTSVLMVRSRALGAVAAALLLALLGVWAFGQKEPNRRDR